MRSRSSSSVPVRPIRRFQLTDENADALRGDLRTARRPPARARARGGAHEAPSSRGDARAARPAARPPEPRAARQARAPPRASGHGRLELRPPRAERAAPVRTPGRVLAAAARWSRPSRSATPRSTGPPTLIDDSLLERGGERLRMLETIREYALEQLAQDDEAADFVGGMPSISSSSPSRSSSPARRTGSRSSMPSGTTCGRRSPGASRPRSRASACGLPPRCGSSGGCAATSPRGAAGSTTRSFAERPRPPELRARALHAAASLATRQGAYGRAAELSEQSLALWEELGDVSGTARSLLSLGHGRRRAGRPGARDHALAARRRALQRVRRPAGPCARGQQPRRDRPRAKASTRRPPRSASRRMALFETLEDSEGMAFALVNQGFAALSRARARARARASPPGASPAGRARLPRRDRLLLRGSRRGAGVHGPG